MNKSNLIIGAVVAFVLVLGTAWVVGGNNQSTALDLGAGTRFPSGISASDTSPNAGDLVVSDDIDLEASAFCIDFHATSTETVLSFTASSTATVTGQTTEGGVMLFNYGSCQ